jgi:hypothetical protein
MKTSFAVLWTLALVAGLGVMGCHKDNAPGEQSPAGVTNEQSAMQYYAVNDEFVKNDEITFADKAVEPMDYTSFGKIDAAVTPLRWGRFITNITKNVTITVQPGDSTAIGKVEKTVTGNLKIRAKTEAGDTVTITKPFTDLSTRYVIFKRIARETERFWMNWVPVASSLINGGTIAPNNLIKIVEIKQYLPGGDSITVTNPETFFLRYRWLRLFNGGQKDAPMLLGGTTVRLRATVVSASADTDVVTLRFGCDMFHARRQRMTFVSQTDNGDGTFTRTFEISWPVHFHTGFFNAGVDAMTRSTLYDDQAPYAVSWWGIPYRVL